MKRGKRRRGAVLIFALVGLIILSVVATSILRTEALRFQTLRTFERRMQAEELVEAGLRRAVDRFAADSAYAGETWTVPAEQLDGHRVGVVKIVVDPNDGPTVTVQAELTAKGGETARMSRTMSLSRREGDPK